MSDLQLAVVRPSGGSWLAARRRDLPAAGALVEESDAAFGEPYRRACHVDTRALRVAAFRQVEHQDRRFTGLPFLPFEFGDGLLVHLRTGRRAIPLRDRGVEALGD